MKNQNILIVEDDDAVLSMLQSVLDYGGFGHQSARTAHAALDAFRQSTFDAVLLDLSLPDLDGSELIRFIRDHSDVPILVVSGRVAEQNRVDTLDLGADDFIPKPFMPRELLARIRAAIRRAEPGGAGGDELPERASTLRFDPSQPVVHVRGSEVRLTALEHRYFCLLSARPGAVVTNRDATEALWGEYSTRTRKSLYVLADRLRRKIEADPSNPAHLIAQHGIGYRLEA